MSTSEEQDIKMNICPQILLINDVCHFIVVSSCWCCCMQLSLKTCNEEKNKTVITNSRGHLCNYSKHRKFMIHNKHYEIYWYIIYAIQQSFSQTPGDWPMVNSRVLMMSTSSNSYYQHYCSSVIKNGSFKALITKRDKRINRNRFRSTIWVQIESVIWTNALVVYTIELSDE